MIRFFSLHVLQGENLNVSFASTLVLLLSNTLISFSMSWTLGQVVIAVLLENFLTASEDEKNRNIAQVLSGHLALMKKKWRSQCEAILPKRV